VLYQLPNGKTIEMSTEEYLNMSDEDLHNLVSYNLGTEVNEPFYGSALRGREIRRKDKKEKDFEEKDLSSVELPDIPTADKLKDQDVIIDDE